MPKIYEYLGFIFFFYSNEHEPIHVHVIKGDRQTVFELILSDGYLIEIHRRKDSGYKMLEDRDAFQAEQFIKAYYKNIIEK